MLVAMADSRDAHIVPVSNPTARFVLSLADRYPGLSGSLLMARIEQDFLVNPRQRMTKASFFPSNGERLLFRDNDCNNRRQDVVVSDYAKRILVEGLLVAFRGIPLARKSTQVEGCTTQERARAKALEPYERERESVHHTCKRNQALEPYKKKRV